MNEREKFVSGEGSGKPKQVIHPRCMSENSYRCWNPSGEVQKQGQKVRAESKQPGWFSRLMTLWFAPNP
jgi:hypothetical protein